MDSALMADDDGAQRRPEEENASSGETLCDGVIDPAALDRLHQWGGDALREKMIRIFLRTSADMVREMEEGLEKGIDDTVERAAHSLKSTSATVGAMTLSGLAAEIEVAASGGHMEAARSRVRSLVEVHDEVSGCLRDFLAGETEGP